ncbi:YbbR-like domain-containing protein [Dysgonomonas sp. 216]|uniref:YbbR-like domain-containing protein n=1 Tax=Dysgonomonas sp. 216 TaxID=2302934 RepID=UPI0013D0B12C|nr:YbbR-like domain-containing protein [Dysgonomonas sp. 216]NDW18905.1 YbbR-like domain-containing protein [Dysgonomonas sp. 216]
MDNNIYHNISEKVRKILVNTPWRKVLTFSFFVLLSSILWFFQIYRQNFTASYDLPIRYISIPDSVIFNTPLPESINITIKDNGYGLFNSYFTKRKDSLTIDISEVFATTSNKVLSSTSLQQAVKNKLQNTATLVNYDPSFITFQYTALKQKKLPVIFNGQVFISSGYLLDGDISILPDTVLAYGPETILNGMNYVYTVNDTIHEYNSESPLKYAIKNIENVKFIPDVVDVYVPIDKYTQKNLQIEIVCINLPEKLEVKFFPSSVKVSFLVGLSQYQQITEKDFVIQLDYNDLKNTRESHVPLRIISMPDHIQSVSMSPADVEFIFEQNNYD